MTSRLKKDFATRIRAHRKELCHWYLEHARMAPPPFYCSIDLRDSGHKIVPVDSNLYPAGFNNICPEDLRSAPPVFRAQVEGVAAHFDIETPRKILILPESHTHNLYYVENLIYLGQIIANAGFEIQFGWYSFDLKEPISLKSTMGKEISAFPLSIENGILTSGDFVPDLVLLNNDFSSGYPRRLDDVKQPIVPTHRLGWHSRRKSAHFLHYNKIAGEFASILGIDPWSIQIETEAVGPVNFNEDQGVEEVAKTVDHILDRVQRAYNAREIKHRPFVFVKNDSGTYGMGIMVAYSGDELRKMNRRTKNKMSVGKNRLPIESVAVQEGVPTATLVSRLAAEPVIYLFGCELVGGFLRTNPERGAEDNLNSPGMVFKKLCMSDLQRLDAEEPMEEEEPDLELVYGAIARISALASGIELRERPFTAPP